ncbi:MAG: hypothetical protein AAF487_13230 [Bacteroidota bacterium]
MKNFSQAKLVKKIKPHHSNIGKYKHNKVKWTIYEVKKMADVFETTVVYLLEETEERELLKASIMLPGISGISKFSDTKKQYILSVLDA